MIGSGIYSINVMKKCSRDLRKIFPLHLTDYPSKKSERFIVVKALRLCTDRAVHGGSRDIAVLYRH